MKAHESEELELEQELVDLLRELQLELKLRELESPSLDAEALLAGLAGLASLVTVGSGMSHVVASKPFFNSLSNLSTGIKAKLRRFRCLCPVALSLLVLE